MPTECLLGLALLATAPVPDETTQELLRLGDGAVPQLRAARDEAAGEARAAEPGTAADQAGTRC